jgi:hypothetical protein
MVRRLVVMVLLIVAGIVIGVLASAQGRQSESTIISGTDVGFRLDPVQRNRHGVTGTLIVRINGVWFEAEFASRPVPATP